MAEVFAGGFTHSPMPSCCAISIVPNEHTSFGVPVFVHETAWWQQEFIGKIGVDPVKDQGISQSFLNWAILIFLGCLKKTKTESVHPCYKQYNHARSKYRFCTSSSFPPALHSPRNFVSILKFLSEYFHFRSFQVLPLAPWLSSDRYRFPWRIGLSTDLWAVASSGNKQELKYSFHHSITANSLEFHWSRKSYQIQRSFVQSILTIQGTKEWILVSDFGCPKYENSFQFFHSSLGWFWNKIVEQNLNTFSIHAFRLVFHCNFSNENNFHVHE